MPDIITEGGCACGAVRYHVHGQSTNSMLCHCLLLPRFITCASFADSWQHVLYEAFPRVLLQRWIKVAPISS
jgi:hypothetical protein